ncbi:cupredoxin domain-containing protein [Motilibacter deserti]|uniref:EfeO-type cupredoxin-like domain-containing protein n=1 Tax=Motilibacter deserti TaxID=2714956 RepID=A0ABX0GY19_9ACTN|nr:hypothetical protein [Motilibacter deserti]NHC15882.1 hypothetical protein [Motilibacter deserti]
MPARPRLLARRTLAGAAAVALAVTALAGCGSDDEDRAAPAPASSSQSSPLPASPSTGGGEPGAPASAEPAKVVTVSVQDGKVVPAPTTVTVKSGDVVRIDATSDQVDTVHVHGIDVELPLDPGVPGELTFVAEPSGSYEVETHESDLLLFKLDVTD